ncbi:PilZ domain-containing protein [Ovoidimarina sediminis]|uniref:PilZ domain-containing protein n=1 Tax=Ovoidimarina sediminis TaxID=3079856 RepID=UPI00292F1BD2|nr:PilZ domain-containing protein [Rhodophyticola sp. MJ-SS7]
MAREPAYHFLRLVATGLAYLAASGASASCAGSTQLDRVGSLVAGIADAGDGDVSRTLLRAVLTYELPPEGDVAPRFRPALSRLTSALDAASVTSGGKQAADRDLSRALAELGAAIDQSGCLPRRPESPEVADRMDNRPSAPYWRGESSGKSPYAMRSLMIFLGSILGAAALSGLAYMLYRRFEPRRSPRHHYVATVMIQREGGGERWTASALDISRSGMKLSGGGEISRGTRLTLAHNGLKQTAIVRWSNEFYYGVEFRPALSRQALRDLLRRHKSIVTAPETKTAPA